MSTKQQIIEPINGISKIILLQYKSDNTKLSLRGFSIQYDDIEQTNTYTNTYMEHVFYRSLRGDSREDIAVLEEMVVNFLDWYIINNDDMESRTKFIKLALLSIGGFRKLQTKAYKNYANNKRKSNVKLALQYYINLINTVLSDINKYKDKNIFKSLLIPDDEETIDLVNVDGFKKIWASDEINKLYDEIINCFDNNLEKKTDEFTTAKVKVLLEILEKKDDMFKNEVTKLLGNNV